MKVEMKQGSTYIGQVDDDVYILEPPRKNGIPEVTKKWKVTKLERSIESVIRGGYVEKVEKDDMYLKYAEKALENHLKGKALGY